jgi:hypothetical protein
MAVYEKIRTSCRRRGRRFRRLLPTNPTGSDPGPDGLSVQVTALVQGKLQNPTGKPVGFFLSIPGKSRMACFHALFC